MRHSFIDKYSDLTTPIHALHPRVKLLVFLALLFYFAAVPITWWIVGLNVLGLTLGTLIARLPFRFVLKRMMIVLPFLVLIILFIPLFQEQSWTDAGITAARAFCSILALILFMSTIPFRVLLDELSRLGVPKFVIQVFSFIYRYFFVLIDELERMELASRARAPNRSRKHYYTALSRMLGMLIIRSYERSERIYQAMQLRGYDWEESEV